MEDVGPPPPEGRERLAEAIRVAHREHEAGADVVLRGARGERRDARGEVSGGTARPPARKERGRGGAGGCGGEKARLGELPLEPVVVVVGPPPGLAPLGALWEGCPDGGIFRGEAEVRKHPHSLCEFHFHVSS